MKLLLIILSAFTFISCSDNKDEIRTRSENGVTITEHYDVEGNLAVLIANDKKDTLVFLPTIKMNKANTVLSPLPAFEMWDCFNTCLAENRSQEKATLSTGNTSNLRNCERECNHKDFLVYTNLAHDKTK